MTRESIRSWMKSNGISIHRLAKYIGLSVNYFTNVLNGKESLTDKTKKKIEAVMAMNDISVVKDMAYLIVPFTRAEWKNIKYIFRDEEYVVGKVHELVMRAVEHIANEQSTFLPDSYEQLTPEENQ